VRSSKDSHRLARRLAGLRRVVAFDYRGRGRSAYDADWRNYRPDVMLRDSLSVVHALGLHPLVLCGTSFGGLLAMAMAVAAPTLLAGVILNDIGPELAGSSLGRVRRYVGEDRREPDWPSAVARVKRMLPGIGFERDEDWRALAEATFRDDGAGALRVDWDVKVARTLTGDIPDLWPLFRALRQLPVLAFRGAQSDVLLDSDFARMLEVKPDLTAVTIPRRGHAPTLDEPEAVLAIEAFLARIDDHEHSC